MTTLLLAESSVPLEHPEWLIGLALLFGLFMAWSIGANDVANAMGTSVGSKALTLKQAIIIAAIFEFAGALLVGRHVSDKIRQKIFDEGERATGRVVLFLKDNIVTTLPKSTLFKTAEGMEFELAAAVSGIPLSDLILEEGQVPLVPTNDGRGKYSLIVKVRAVARGDAQNIGNNSLLTGPESVPNLVVAAAAGDFQGGRPGAFDSILNLYAYGMLAALLAAAAWLMAATYFGLPVSTTHTIIGAVVGFGMMTVKWDQIMWGEVGKVVASWVVSPVMAGAASYALFVLIHKRILVQKDMVGSARRLAPILMFFVFLTIFLVTLYKGLKPVLKPLGLEDMGFLEALLLASPLSLVATLCCVPLVRRVRVEGSWPAGSSHNPALFDEVSRLRERWKKILHVTDGKAGKDAQNIHAQMEALESRLSEAKSKSGGLVTRELQATERIFVYLQILSACALAFAHGANDVANAVGPLAGVILVAQFGAEGLNTSINDSGMWGVLILVLGGIGIVLGLGTWGWRVIETIGKKITELTPTRGFAAQFGAAITILIASRQGLPISTTHTLVGAVLGVGLARGVGALNFRVIRDITISWVVTLPAGALLTIVFYFILKASLGG